MKLERNNYLGYNTIRICWGKEHFSQIGCVVHWLELGINDITENEYWNPGIGITLERELGDWSIQIKLWTKKIYFSWR